MFSEIILEKWCPPLKISQASKIGDNLFKGALYNINEHRFHVCSPNIVTATLRPTQQAECDTTDTRVLPFSALHNNAAPIVSLSLLPASWVLVQMTDSRWRLRKMFCACRECPLLSYYLLSSQARIMLNSSLVVPAPLPPLHQKKEQSFSVCSECTQTFMYFS